MDLCLLTARPESELEVYTFLIHLINKNATSTYDTIHIIVYDEGSLAYCFVDCVVKASSSTMGDFQDVIVICATFTRSSCWQ